MHFIDINICAFIIDCYSKKNEPEPDRSPETVTVTLYQSSLIQ